MLPTILISVFLTAAEPAAVRLAAPGLKSVGAPADLVTFYSDHFSQQLTLRGLRVVTSSEIESMLGFERQKQLLGCSDAASSCMAELANALGVDALITGSLGKFGDTYQVNLKILSAADAKPLSVRSLRVEGDKALLDALSAAAAEIAPEVFTALKRPVPPAALQAAPTGALPSPSGATAAGPAPFFSGARGWFWVPAAIGGISTIVAFASDAEFREYRKLILDAAAGRGNDDLRLVEEWYGAAKENQERRNVSIGVSAAAFAAAGALLLWGGSSSPVQATAWITPAGAGAGIEGRLP